MTSHSRLPGWYFQSHDSVAVPFGRAHAARLGRLLRLGLVLLSTASLLLGALIPTDVSVEAILAILACIALAILARKPRTGVLRGLTLTISTVLTLRYFAWRFSDTLVYFDPVSMTASIALLIAELYCLAMSLLGLFVNFAPITRPLDPNPLNASDPVVDVLIPSYNEDAGLLAVTLAAATQIRYPPGRLRVHLLDDGGTDAKCADPNPAKAQAAQARRASLQALATSFGATYRTRLTNDHAKAGNINYALPRLDGDLVLILDADHVPTADILARTVPFYRHDPKLFLVQTPHFFMNPDTIEKNLDLFLKMPGENEMFHRAIQSGLDFWNATVFVGSAGLMHRGRLLEVGGIATKTITEDAETALALHAKGYTSACVARPMVAGLAPETFTGMVVQRVRWGQGMLQILLLQNPIGRPGLTLAQRLGYLNSTLYWLFPFARVVFIAAPVAYLIFGLKIYAASVPGILAFAVPHVYGSFVASSTQFKRFRWPMVSHVYETLLGMLMLRPLVATLRSPRAPDFKVTPKGEHLDSDFISPLVKPFYVIFAVTLAALPAGLFRMIEDENHRILLLITLGWETFNLMVMTAALGALYERKQRRTNSRLDSDFAAVLQDGDQRLPGRLVNLSIGGASFVPAPGNPWQPPLRTKLDLMVTAPHEPEPVHLHVEIRSDRGGSKGLFFCESAAEFRSIVSLVHGDSARWVSLWERESRSCSALNAFVMMTRTGVSALWSHARHLLAQALTRITAPRRSSHRLGQALSPVLLLLLLATPPAPARAADPTPASIRQESEWTERLADINPAPGPITLRSDRGEAELFFNLSTRMEPVAARLHLELSNSQALLPGRSQIAIRLNDVVVAQLALKPDAPLSRLDVDLPVELLRAGSNRLNFTAAQHYTNECEFPGAAELWSQIDTTRSRLTLRALPLDAAPVLSDLQALIGPGFFGGREFTFMTPGPAASLPDAAIAAGTTLAQALALRLRYQPAVLGFAPASPDGSDGPGLHLAAPPAPASTAGSLPDIMLFGTLDALRPILGTEIAAAVTAGFVGVYPLPSDPTRLVLVVSGRDEAELDRAATAFGIANFPFVDAAAQTVDTLSLQPHDSFFASNMVKEGARTSFAEMGLRTVTMRGMAGRAGLDAVLPADLFVADSSEVELSLDYAYGAGIRSDSVMNMFINGQFEQAIPLADRNGAVLRGYRIRVPARKLTPGRNRIEFEVVMTPLVSGACIVPETRNMILTLADTSTITLNQGSHYAAQPDLHLFAATGFPYAGSDTFDLALAARDPTTVAAAWTLSARLAQVAGRVLTEAHVVVGAPAAGRHAIIIGAAPDLPAELAAALPVQLGPKNSLPYTTSAPTPGAAASAWHMLSGMLGIGAAASPLPPSAPASRLVGTGPLGRNGLVMAAQAPDGSPFTLTAVTAQTPEALAAAVRSLVRPQLWPRLEEDVSLWRPASAGADTPPDMKVQRVGSTYHLGSFRSFGALRYLVGEYPWVWVGALVAAALMLVMMLRLFLLARLRRTHPGSHEGIP